MTPTEELRTAATKLRDRGNEELTAFVAHLSLADWLETEAASNAGDEIHDGCTGETCATTAALAVARAINGEEHRP